MRPEITQGTGARQLPGAAPGPGQRWIIKKTLIKPASETHQFTDFSALDDLLGYQRRRSLDVVKGYQCLNA